VNLYARVRGTRRRRVTRRRSRRAATHASIRRAAWATRPIPSRSIRQTISPIGKPASRPLAARSRAIFALRTGLPTMGCAMRDQFAQDT
jgi:hypothetical protein